MEKQEIEINIEYKEALTKLGISENNNIAWSDIASQHDVNFCSLFHNGKHYLQIKIWKKV